MKKIALILSGSGYLDGSEITEAVSSLICLSQAGVEYCCFAPRLMVPSVDHLTQTAGSPRDVLVESARLARSQISPLSELNEAQFDGLLLPGGFGAAKNLCTWAEKGARCDVLPDVEKIINAFYQNQKPIAAMCIAPALVARVLGKHGVNVTIGNDPATVQEIAKTGAVHEDCPVTDYVSDRDHRILSTPAYMYEAKPHEVFTGISKMIREFVELA